MNSESGWYLPFLYIDGYIDRHGPFSVARAIDDVTKGTVDEELCEKLSWFIKQCSGKDGNKCYDKETKENYITDEDMVYNDIASKKTLFLFGFSETLSKVMQRAKGLKSYSIISSPFGDHNHLLQFTDALVISKHSWEAADSEKQRAMLAFIKYFTSTKFRHGFVMGTDLKIKTPRFRSHFTTHAYTYQAGMRGVASST